MKCKVCKNPKSLEDHMVHTHTTHGVSIDMQKFRFGYIPDENKLKEIMEEHRKIGKKSVGKFGLGKSYEV